MSEILTYFQEINAQKQIEESKVEEIKKETQPIAPVEEKPAEKSVESPEKEKPETSAELSGLGGAFHRGALRGLPQL